MVHRLSDRHPDETQPAREGRLVYDPALDGVRALGVGLVLLFHGGVSWATGGFLGVSIFFTLSGFLITSLLLTEQASTGAVHLGHFWIRRLRRLMPAALACLALVIVLAATVLHSAKATLRGDVIGALADVANWRFYFSGQSYAALFAVPSPVQHFWSLAIEEQFYLCFPVLVWLVLSRLRWSRAVLAAMLGIGFVASAAASIALGGSDPDLVYYGTFTRAAELLAGCLLAMAVTAWGRRQPSQDVAAWPFVAGPLALIGILVVVWRTSELDEWLYRGGLAAFSLLSVVLIVAVRRPGPVRWVLTQRPLVALGLISYGVYLYHWPLFLWLTADRTGLDGWALFAFRVAVTLAVAGASYYLLEQPIRRGRALTGWRGAAAPPIAMACLVAALLPLAAPGAAASSSVVTLPPVTTAATTLAPTTLTTTLTIVPPTTVPPTTVPAPPVRVVVFGDSTAKANAAGLIAWGTDTGQAVVSDAGTIDGCGISRSVNIGFQTSRFALPDGCKSWPTFWPQVLAANPADIAVIGDGPWELVEHQLAGDQWRQIGDPVYDAHIHDELLAATDVLLAHVPRVVWFTNLYFHPAWGTTQAGRTDPINDRTRVDRLNAIIHEVAAERPAVVLVDLAAHMASIPGADTDQSLRPDGVHLSPAASRIMADWYGPQIVAAARGS
jgi:peptidoglycan/LPS O-acetylase OafA/YrhL